MNINSIMNKFHFLNPLSTCPTKWSNTLKELFECNQPFCGVGAEKIVHSFQNTVTIETGISDFHKKVITIIKVFYKKQTPKIIQYRSFKNFDNQVFQRELDSELLKIDLNNADSQDLLKSFYQYLTSMLQKNKSLYELIS